MDAARAREHLKTLRAAGVGRRTVADITGIAQSTLADVAAGRRQHLRALAEQAILDVTAEAGVNGATLVDASELLARLDAVRRDEGWSRLELGRQLGYARQPQFNTAQMTARNVARVQRFLRRLDAPLAPADARRAIGAALELPIPKACARLRRLAQRCKLAVPDADPWTMAAALRRQLP